MNRLIVILILLASFFFVKGILDLNFAEEQEALAALRQEPVDLTTVSNGDTVRVSPVQVYDDLTYIVGRPNPGN
jgi:hypothetical protein